MDASLQTRQGLKRKRVLETNTATACDQCHRCKVRCSSGRPCCERCEGIGSICTYSLGKPLGKPPKSARRKVWRPTPASSPHSVVASGERQDGDFGFVQFRRHEDVNQTEPVPQTEIGYTENRDMSLASSLQHEFAYTRPVSAPYDDRTQLEHGQGDNPFSASAAESLFSPAQDTDLDLGFLVDTDFNRYSIMPTGSPSSPVATTAVVVASVQPSSNQSDSFSRPCAVTTPGPSSYPTPTSRPRPPATSSNELPQETLPMSSTSPRWPFSPQATVQKPSPDSPQTLLESITHLCSRIPSAKHSLPISEILRLARQGLQAVHQCLPRAQSPTSEGSGLTPARSANQEASILACILLMQQVLSYYESLHHRPLRATAMMSPPSSSTDAHPPLPGSSIPTPNPVHAAEPIRIGNFEVECFASRQLILDAVVAAEKQETRIAVWELERWCRELVEQGRREGLLAGAFLKALKRRLDDPSS